MGDQLKSTDLAGATILAAGELTELGERWPVLTIRTRGGRFVRLVICRDEEGNGPGAFSFEEVTAGDADEAERAGVR
jgi:hypothetical protein